jgi:hypothetical protein
VRGVELLLALPFDLKPLPFPPWMPLLNVQQSSTMVWKRE